MPDPEARPDPETPPAPEAAAVERAFRESAGRAVATLVRVFGDIDLAEDAVREALPPDFAAAGRRRPRITALDRKSTRLNSSHI